MIGVGGGGGGGGGAPNLLSGTGIRVDAEEKADGSQSETKRQNDNGGSRKGGNWQSLRYRLRRKWGERRLNRAEDRIEEGVRELTPRPSRQVLQLYGGRIYSQD